MACEIFPVTFVFVVVVAVLCKWPIEPTFFLELTVIIMMAILR